MIVYRVSRSPISPGFTRASGRIGRMRGALLVMLFLGSASCRVTAPARSLSKPCIEPVEVVDRVEKGLAVLVGRDESDVRIVPAGSWTEGTVLSKGRPSPSCGLWLRRHTKALMRWAQTRRGYCAALRSGRVCSNRR